MEHNLATNILGIIAGFTPLIAMWLVSKIQGKNHSPGERNGVI